MARTHTVLQGECLASIARHYGFGDPRTIYEDPANAGLRAARPNPNILYPGDEVHIPDKTPRPIPVQTGATHRFRLKVRRTLLRLVLKDDAGEALSHRRYRLTVGSDQHFGVTTAEGLIEEQIRADARQGTLTLWDADETVEETTTIPLKIGQLHPVDETTGVQARLNNLGFGCGPVDGVADSETEQALSAFQAAVGLTVTGTADDATREKLREEHDQGL